MLSDPTEEFNPGIYEMIWTNETVHRGRSLIQPGLKGSTAADPLAPDVTSLHTFRVHVSSDGIADEFMTEKTP